MISILKMIFRLRHILFRVVHQNGTPAERARGLAIGVFIGSFPLFGFQTFLGIALAILFRGNQFLAVLGTWVSNPLTYLPLYWLNYQVGCIVIGDLQGDSYMGGQLSLQNFASAGWDLVGRLFVGSSIVGFILGLTSFLTIYIIFRLFYAKH